MKKLLFVLIIMALALSGCDTMFNNENNPDGTNVSGAKGKRDGTYVKISGTIEEEIAREWYKFSDTTGSISVEIDGEVWARAGINPATVTFPASFEIVGEVDKDRGQEAIIDAERIRKL